MDINRRSFIGLTGAAGLAVLTAQGSQLASAAPASGPVTIDHAFGQTTIPAPPKRVVSAGFTEQDDLLALGVVPIATTAWWGDEPFEVWPWARPKLGNAQPTVLSIYSDAGFEFDRIAGLNPDLIVATNAGVDQDKYNRLSAIAPTIPQSAGQPPFFEPWQVQANTIGQAVFKAGEMASLVAAAERKLTDVARANPQFAGKTVQMMQGTFFDDGAWATLPGWRTNFLTDMGLVVPDTLRAFTFDDHRAFIPRDQVAAALGGVDVLIWTTQSPEDQAGLLAEPSVQQLNAASPNRSVYTGRNLAAAIAFSSPLSLPVVADQLPPLLKTAVIAA
ncbi:MAG TPA: ABC transporter substrate-binding protein [Mycobacterium sp.]|nr:ABC transporter substrate-binding protein [Mycobacterium sp.]